MQSCMRWISDGDVLARTREGHALPTWRLAIVTSALTQPKRDVLTTGNGHPLRVRAAGLEVPAEG
jgi:uncharacterized protein YjhX (UPF0386 family)